MSLLDASGIFLNAHGTVAAILAAAYLGRFTLRHHTAQQITLFPLFSDQIRRRVFDQLNQRLEPVFQKSDSTPTLILAGTGCGYAEKRVNPVGSELYRDAVHDFLKDNMDSIADYRRLKDAESRCIVCTRVSDWLFFLLLIWQIFATVAFFGHEVTFWALTDCLCLFSVVPTAALAVALLFAEAALKGYSNIVAKVGSQYENSNP